MAEVTGPISTLPGQLHGLPDGSTCDYHPDRPAVVRMQAETDSFGAELWDMCQECWDKHRKEMREADHSGTCDWCKTHKPRLRPQRDHEEGLYGRVYEVCDDCIKRVNEEAEHDLEARGYYDEPDDLDDDDDFDASEDADAEI